jgi:uncharacterized membrane protein
MNQAERQYGLLSETSGIGETRDPRLQRHLPPLEGFRWLRSGWADFAAAPLSSLAYGIGVFILSLAFVWTLVEFGRDYILLPALGGFLIVAPVLATGLYEKSRAMEQGRRVSLGDMLRIRPAAGAQMLFAGLLIMMLVLLWNRAAILVWALFFGVSPFPGLERILGLLFGTTRGWTMVFVGSAIGGLFAAFAFAVSVFSVPMMLDQRIDAPTAMGRSMKLVWNNLRPMIIWGALVMALFAVCVVTGLLGMIVIFPVLGHATWHAYRDVATEDTLR